MTCRNDKHLAIANDIFSFKNQIEKKNNLLWLSYTHKQRKMIAVLIIISAIAKQTKLQNTNEIKANHRKPERAARRRSHNCPFSISGILFIEQLKSSLQCFHLFNITFYYLH